MKEYFSYKKLQNKLLLSFYNHRLIISIHLNRVDYLRVKQKPSEENSIRLTGVTQKKKTGETFAKR